MTDGYTTVFEVSYLSNGTVLKASVFLSIGIFAFFALRKSLKSRVQKFFFFFVWLPVWLAFSSFWLYLSLRNAREFNDALKMGRCDVIEGVVTVLHEQPRSGHASGDRIRIGNKEFQFSYFTSGLSYDRTISHGGVLTNGATARLHYLDNAILKVEVK